MINRLTTFFIICNCLFSVDYETEIQPIFNFNCGNCHIGNSSGGVNLSSYQNVMDSDVITPFDANDSELYDLITESNNGGDDMPPGNAELTDAQITLIQDWINEGALPEEPTDTCDVDSGDVNGDGTLNVLDVVSIVHFVLGSGSVTFECAADFNSDLVVNVLDIVSLVNEILS